MKAVSFMRTAPTELGEVRGVVYRNPLSLDALIITHPTSTYFFRVGDGLDGGDDLGVACGDVLVVDRSVVPSAGNIVIRTDDDSFMLWRVVARDRFCAGISAHEAQDVTVESDCTLSVWGTVTAIVRSV